MRAYARLVRRYREPTPRPAVRMLAASDLVVTLPGREITDLDGTAFA